MYISAIFIYSRSQNKRPSKTPRLSAFISKILTFRDLLSTVTRTSTTTLTYLDDLTLPRRPTHAIAKDMHVLHHLGGKTRTEVGFPGENLVMSSIFICYNLSWRYRQFQRRAAAKTRIATLSFICLILFQISLRSNADRERPIARRRRSRGHTEVIKAPPDARPVLFSTVTKDVQV